MSRLTIDITDHQHQSLKALAAVQGKTIRQYAIERLFPSQADSDQAWLELKALLERRIGNGSISGGLTGGGLTGGTTSRSIDTILEEELGRGSPA